MISRKKKKKKFPQFSACKKNEALANIKPLRYEIEEKILNDNQQHYIQGKTRPHRLARSRTPDFHSDNRGSNPLGVIASL